MTVLRDLCRVVSQWYEESESEPTAAELRSVAAAVPTPGAVSFLEECRELGLPVVVVSDNAPEVIRAFLTSTCFGWHSPVLEMLRMAP